jgi:CRISPR-associated protein Cas5t
MKLYITVPVASFRIAQAREYWESYPCAPPSTVYGMLLSAVGEENRLAHIGSEIAIAILQRPERSRVLRTTWRLKDKKLGLAARG